MNASMTRRDFVAATALSLGASACATVKAPPNRTPLKIGLIGCGGRGTGAALQALRADPNTTLWAVGDLFEDRAAASLQQLRKELGEASSARIQVDQERRFLGFESYRSVIDSGVDVVLLVTPPAFRPQQFEYAVQAKKHVFMEKPVAVDSTGIRRVFAAAAAARQQQLTVFCGFCWRYDHRMRAVFQQLNAGALGEIVSVHTTYHAGTLSPRPRQPGWSDMEWQLRNWWHFTWISGDHIVEQAVHSIDRLAWALNDELPVRCNALGGRQARKGAESGHVYDHFAVIYEYANGRRGHHTCRQIDGCPADNTDYVYGTKGTAVINGWAPPHHLKDLAGNVIWSSHKDDKSMYQNEHDELFAGIRSGNVIWHGAQMCNSTLMAIMGRMSAYTGQTISWEQAWNAQEDLLPARLALGPIALPPVAIPGVTKIT